MDQDILVFFEGRFVPLREARIGPVTVALRKLYVQATRGRLPAYQHWVLPVYRPAAVQAA